MSFWKNKHMTVAMLVAPLLGVGSYFLVDHFVGEKPQAAEAGQSYPLVAKPNCRRGGGYCGLKNKDFELTLSYEKAGDGRLLLKLESVYPLDGVMIALGVSESEQNPPAPMLLSDEDGMNWSIEIANPDPDRHRLYLAASSGQSLYFGDVATKFTGNL